MMDVLRNNESDYSNLAKEEYSFQIESLVNKCQYCYEESSQDKSK